MQYKRRTNSGDLSFILSPSDRDLHGTLGKLCTGPRTSPRFEQFSKASFVIGACSPCMLGLTYKAGRWLSLEGALQGVLLKRRYTL